MNLNELTQAVAALTARVEALEAAAKPRDRGPKSEQTMTEAHAFAVKFGDDAKLSHKQAAEKHGLSYGQIFSCRGGYTFKQVTKDWKPKTEPAETPAAETSDAK